jgi:Spy/CpxP family protein refolding chaperone
MKQAIVFSLAVLLAPALAAQQGGRDSVRQRPDSAEAAQLRSRIEDRFNQRLQENLKLSSDQSTKLKATQEKFGTQRRALMQQQQDRRRALDDQMQPGVAANPDSVNKLIAGLQSGRAQMLKLEQDQDNEMSRYLTPVQRAQYQTMREGFMRRVGEMRREGRGMGGGRGQGMGGRAPRRRGI